MFKKVLVGAVIAVVALVVIKSTWLGSHFRLWAKGVSASAREQITPEREIERLRMELSNLKGADERFLDKVARQALSAEKLEAQVSAAKKDLAKREKDLKAMHAALATKDEFVVYNGEKYGREKVREQLKLDFMSLEGDEQVVESKETHLAELKKSLAVNRKKLNELKVQRERMATDLQRLETALAEERRVQAEQSSTIDDPTYRKLTEEIAAVKDRIEFLKKRRELRGEATDGPVRVTEQQREAEAKLKARMDRRFGDAQ